MAEYTFNSLKEADSVIQVSYWNLSIVGIWPYLKSSKKQKAISNTAFVIAFVLMGYFMAIGQTTKLFLTNGNLDVIVHILCIADIPIVNALIKIVALRYSSKAVKLLLREFFHDWNKPWSIEQLTMMQKNAKISRKIALTIFGSTFTNFVILTLPYILILIRKLNNEEERFLLLDAYYPYDAYKSPWFELTWFLQSLGSFLASSTSIGFNSLFCILVIHLCGQLHLLKIELNKISNLKNRLNFKAHMSYIARRHRQLNRFAEVIKKTFCWMILVQIITFVTVLCLLGYQCFRYSTDLSKFSIILRIISMVTFIVYTSLVLYFYCYVGEKLRIKSIELADAAYNSKWYELKPNEIRDLAFVIKRAQNPLQISAGKFCILSISLFSKMVKTSLGYLSILLAIKEKTSSS